MRSKLPVGAQPLHKKPLASKRLIHLKPKANVESKETQATGSPSSGEVKSLWLPTESLFQSVCLEILPLGSGQAITVTDVEKGSIAEQAGLASGQAIVGISDALRDDQIWPITNRPTMRFLKQVLRMRMRGQVQLQTQWHEELQRQIDAAAGGGAAAPPAPPPPQQQQGAAAEPSKSAMSNLDTMLGGEAPASGASSSNDSGEAPATVGEAMAKKYETDQARKAETQGMSEVRQRKKRRADYLGEVNKRNDAPLLLGLLLAFVGPAAIILAIAFSTGYIDNLVQSSITIR
eukprot:CAMPEP_0202352770 /NCGR_PEP_ID=MMETSP1126-20121109/8820_1 /ASSEMBLY_ACC=CAM_ASM_000457 /TAXON_ID=3047 /ORGANISM="Dunaliella tertiolecta, Strain CCMP1320" /LENGTH=289 /DNA_ID=CAMNT_0048945029 /DNA_START=1195 /DNA_END=2064 /DNA_ORIENTATION=-